MPVVIDPERLRAAIDDALDDMDDTDSGLRLMPNYVGRGPTRPCVAMGCDQLSSVIAVLIKYAAANESTAFNMALAMRTDQLGLGFVAYFPGFVLKSEQEIAGSF